MKRLCAIPFALCLVASSAFAQSGADMLRACQLLQSGMHREGDTIYLPPGADVNQCWGFMSAVLQYASLADQSGKPLNNACPGPGVSVVDVIRLYVEYARAHPDKLQLRAAAVAYNAMADAFPCK